MRALLAAFQAAPPPVAGLAQEAEEGTEAAMPDASLLQARKERQRLLADAASLRADPRFSDLLRSLAQALPAALLQAPALAAALPPARRRLAALYTAKVRSYPSTAPFFSFFPPSYPLSLRPRRCFTGSRPRASRRRRGGRAPRGADTRRCASRAFWPPSRRTRSGERCSACTGAVIDCITFAKVNWKKYCLKPYIFFYCPLSRSRDKQGHK